MPQPVQEEGYLRLEVGLPGDLRRYVFVEANDRLGEIARTISEPDIQLKLGGSAEEMHSAVGSGWVVTTSSKMMTSHARSFRKSVLPTGYRDCVTQFENLATVEILAEDGSLAASGRAAEYAGVFCYDQIVTQEAHRRKGLGSYLMAQLLLSRRSPASRQVLTATRDGFQLYSSLGWQVHSPWITAMRPT